MKSKRLENIVKKISKPSNILKKVLVGSAMWGILNFPSPVNAQWVEQTNGLPDWDAGYAIEASDANNSVLAIHTADGTQIYKTIDGGDLWTGILPSGESSLNIKDISLIDDQHIWFSTGYPGEIYNSTDGGANWTKQYSDPNATPFINYIEMFNLENGIAMGDAMPGSDVAVFLKTSDGGTTWNSVNDSPVGGWSGDMWRRMDFINENVGYFYESGVNPQKLYKTIDGCSTWSETNFPAKIQVLKFFNEEIGLAIPTESNKVYRTLDGGDTWESFSTPHTGWGIDIEFSPLGPSSVWFSDMVYIYYSNDTGRTWVEQINGINGNVRDIDFGDDVYGWFLTDNSVYQTPNAGGGKKLSIEDENNNTLPERYELYQNIPNPWNPSTMINYRLPEAGYLELKVFNSLGREVKTLVSGYEEAGLKQVEWDGKDQHSRDVASGMYIYTINARSIEGDNQFTQSKKMVLIR